MWHEGTRLPAMALSCYIMHGCTQTVGMHMQVEVDP